MTAGAFFQEGRGVELLKIDFNILKDWSQFVNKVTGVPL